MSDNREREIVAAFVALSSRLVDGYDVVDLLSGLTTDCARLLDVDSAGLLLADPHGVLHLLAASSQATRDVELYQLQRAEGPCLDCYQAGAPVSVPDLSEETARWPQFTAAAMAAGFASVHAVPMRLRDQVLGTLGLFGAHTGALADDDLSLGQAFAHVASVALVQGKAVADKDAVVSQLQLALSSRVVLEQAKGILAQTGDLDMEQAFASLRRYARDHNLKLSALAASVVARETAPRQILDHFTERLSTKRAVRPNEL